MTESVRNPCHVTDARDFYMLKSGPDQIEFGHVCEDPHTWEQRYEKKDLAKHRHQGQVATPSGLQSGYS
jgi:hypothetical protein